MQDDNWKPLESNPEVMTEQALSLGLKIEKATFHDLLGFEEWAFDMIPKPVYAVIFNFPITPAHYNYVEQEYNKIKEQGQYVDPSVFFMKQYAQNACGTIAIVHASVNNPELIQPDSHLDNFSKQVQHAKPDEAGKLFKQANGIKQAHVDAVCQGDSHLVDEVDRHFIAYILKNGRIYELDGAKEFPIHHGESTPENFLKDVSELIKQFFERDPTQVSFSTVVLAHPAAE